VARVPRSDSELTRESEGRSEALGAREQCSHVSAKKRRERGPPVRAELHKWGAESVRSRRKRARGRRLALLVVLVAISAWAQEKDPGEDALNSKVPRLEVHDGTLFNGIARLSAEPGDLSFSFEFVLAPSHVQAAQPEPIFSVLLENSSVRTILDALCAFDTRYTWSRDKSAINVYPRATVGDGSYLMNRTLPRLDFKGVTNAEDAMFGAVSQLPPPFEQIAFAQAGGDISYSAPWGGTFEGITMRQALNLIARNLGPRGGWVLSGSQDFRTVGFHNRRIHEQSRDPGQEHHE
jgi:hypothetical protein